MTNHDFAALGLETNDEWIVERTGIRERHIAVEGETTCTMAAAAARQAMQRAGVSAGELDAIVLSTATTDRLLPSTAVDLQAELGASRAAAFDISAACAGFIYGATVAEGMIATGVAETVLVVGAERMSSIVDWKDRSTCVLFGDGAGAVVLQAGEGKGDNHDQGVLNTKLFSDGRLHDLLYVDGGPSTTGTTGFLRMQGREVFKHAVTNISAAVHAAADEAGVKISEVDWFVPHQANQRILDGTGRKLGIPHGKVISTVADHGNTSAASVPLALATAVRDGRIKRGDLLLLEAMGGGLTWGSALVRW
jgi:3-oxoacyl-[acyl-carrier-protein] synthase-3